MKSLYQDKHFAEYWNERAGESGEIYKRMVLDPIMLKAIGSLEGKVVLELGCGNGYLGPIFVSQNPSKVILMDISEHNLRYAREKCDDRRMVFLEQDATTTWRVDSDSTDIVYSNMMLNEVEDIATPLRESFRVLKNAGQLVFSVTHPSWDLFVYAQQLVGKESKIFVGLGNYFKRGMLKYVMGKESKTDPALAEKFSVEFKVEHYQRTLSDYFNQLVDVGFRVVAIFEPELSDHLLKENPRFSDYRDHPIGLIFHCWKRDSKETKGG